MGNERVRPPRLILEGAEREMALAVLKEARSAQKNRSALGKA
jgi:hypothetical protein